jgi:excinuclease ABC subunit A
LFTYIRDLFAALPEARVKGLGPGHFSFNVPGGRCENCSGDGVIKVEMQFLSDVYLTCEVCGGQKFKSKILEVLYQGKNIFEVLELTVAEAKEFFKHHSAISQKLKTLDEVGLGYIKLGQSATTFSGGEAQRIKLATELSRRATGKTLYILDEPTTGLHFADIDRLLKVLNMLVDQGNTVLIIEHNLDVIKSVDWVIDLGPEGGEGGGYVVGAGTPPDIAKITKSYTGQYLKRVM